jgi:hypothetical protein
LVEVMMSFAVLLVVLVPISYLLQNVLGQTSTSRNKIQALSLAEKWIEKLNSTGPPAAPTPNKLPTVGNLIYEGTTTAPTGVVKYTVSGTFRYYTTAKFTWAAETGNPNLCTSATVPQILALSVTTSYHGGSVTDTTETDYPPTGLPTYGFLGVQLAGSPTSPTDPTPPVSRSGQRWGGQGGRVATVPVAVTSTATGTVHESTAGPEGCAFFELPVGTYKVKVGTAAGNGYRLQTPFVTTGSTTATTIAYAPVLAVALSKVTIAGPFQYDEGAYIDVQYADSTVNDGTVLCPDEGGIQCLVTGQGTAGRITAATSVLSGTSWSSTDLPAADDTEKIESTACSSSFCAAVGFGAAGGAAVTDAVSHPGDWVASSPPSALRVLTLRQVRCPSSTGCLAIGTTATGAVILGAVASSAVTGGFSLTWSKDALPSGVTLTSATGITCAGTTGCFVVGTSPSGPVVLAGAGTGAPESWVQDSLTLPSGSNMEAISQMKCASKLACFIVGTASSGPVVLVGAVTTSPEAWTKESLPLSMKSITGIACAATTACLVGGMTTSTPSVPEVLATSVTTTAQSWVQDALPMTMKTVSQLTCAVTACFAIGTDGQGDGIIAGPASAAATSWVSDTVPVGLTLTRITCTATTSCAVTGVVPTATDAVVLTGVVTSESQTFTVADLPAVSTADALSDVTRTGRSATGDNPRVVHLTSAVSPLPDVGASSRGRAPGPAVASGVTGVRTSDVHHAVLTATPHLQAPTVTSFSPTTGSTSGGTTVTVNGTNLTGATSVRFGTTAASSFTVTSSTRIKAVTAPHVAGTAKISVTTFAGNGTSSSTFRFVAPVPAITSFTPATGTTSGGTTVTVTGTGFFGATAVKFGTTTAVSYTVLSPSQIKATTDPHVAGTVRVSVTTPGGTATSSGSFRYIAPVPTITSFTPVTGPTGGGTTLTVTGTGFFGATAVKFGSTTAASYTVSSPTQIRAVTKAHAAGTVAVSVISPGGTGTLATHFRFVPPPTVSTFAPTAGPTAGGTTVTITGTNLTGCTAVRFGSTTANSFTVTSPTQIKAVTKAHAAGTVAVSVTTGGGTADSTSDYRFAAAPTVTSFTPTTGTTSGGTPVTVSGSNLTGATAVKFGTTAAASYTVTSTTTIKAVTKAHAAGTVTIKVTTPGGTATSSDHFTFVAAPTITSFTPTAGPTGGGATVTITGTNFKGSNFTTTAIKFGTTVATTFTVTSATTIKAKTKAHAAGTVTITVTTPGGTATSSGHFTFAAAPTISSFTPTAGPSTGGTAVTITGTNFKGSNFTTTSVKFGSTTAASFTVTSSTTIKAVTKAHAAGTVTVSVTSAGGTATSATDFKFVAAPTITSFTPGTGTTSGGVTVTITGTNLTGATAINFGTTTAASFTVTSSTTIKAVTRSHVAGTVTVSVTTVGGTATSTSHFRYVAPIPTITSFTPGTGTTSGGVTVTVTGTGFIGATAVKFGTTTAASFTVTGPTTIKAVTRTHAAGTVKISVTTAGGTGTSTGEFTFVPPPPTVTSFTPTTGTTSGGTTVTITGTNFSGSGFTTTSVKFGTTTAASYTVTGPTTIKAVTRTHVAGTVKISVTTAGGTGSSSASFRFVAPVPTITSFTPTAGPTAGSTTVTITGTGFIGATSVKFGATTAASYTVTGPTTIKAVTKAHSAGTVTVSVTTVGGTANSTADFIFVPPPTVTSLTPTAGPSTGGTAVTITGTNFKGSNFTTTSVKFGSTTAASFTVTSSTTIKAVTKAHAAGTVTVSVTSAGGTATSATDFKFVAAPTITSFTPGTGTTSGGVTVTITGTNLTGATAINFGTTTAASFTVTSSTTIKAVTRSHVAGTVTVSVTTVGGTATSTSHFRYVAPIPTITSFTPGTGTTSGGVTVTVTGTGFIGATAVKFGTTTAASFTVTGPTTIKAVTRTHAAGTVKISVTTAGGTGTSTTNFRFVAPVPTIVTVTPLEGPATGGTTVTITGTGLIGATAVKFGATTAASYTVTGPTTITAVTRAHAAGTVAVSVTTAGGTATYTPDFKFVPAPTITGFTPAAGPANGSGIVTITGTNLTGATAVRFGTTTAGSISITSSTTIRAVTRAHAAGTVKISVTTIGGTATSASSYRFVPAPTVTSFTPTAGSATGSTTVTITGTNLTGTTAVEFGTTTAASVTVTSGTQIKAVTRAHAPGTFTLSVTTPGGTTTSTGRYRFIAAPKITSFAPATGPVAGGTTVTIDGTGFTGASSVRFGTTTAASYTVTSSSQIKAVTRAHLAGTLPISVTTLGGTAGSAGQFQFLPPPIILSLTPTSGSADGRTTVTLRGTDLGTTSAVSFGTVPGTTIQIESSTRITVKTPAHAAGRARVSVTTTGGSATETTAFTFVTPVPVITTVNPDVGVTAGGTIVTITGTFLSTATAVTFGTADATKIVEVRATEIEAKTPAHATGHVAVSVTTPQGTATKPTAFTFVTLPPVAPVFVSGAACYKSSTLVCVAAGATKDGAVLLVGTKQSTGAFSWSTHLPSTPTGPVRGLVAADLPVSVTNASLSSGSFVACTGTSSVPCTAPGPLFPFSNGYSVGAGSCSAEMATSPSVSTQPGTPIGTAGAAVTLPVGLLRVEVVNTRGQPVAGASVKVRVADTTPQAVACNTLTLPLGTTGVDGTVTVTAPYERYAVTVSSAGTTATAILLVTPTAQVVAPTPQGGRGSTALLPSPAQVTL